MRDSTSNRIHELDLLRVVAALSVMFYHFGYRGCMADDLTVMHDPLLAPVFRYGYLGVELFFMISGFVILMTASAAARVSDFIISRAVRLYPAFWFATVMTFSVIVLWGAPRFSVSVPQLFANMPMTAQFFGWNSINGFYWSLYEELRFYVLIALLIAVGRLHHIEKYLAVWICLSLVLPVDGSNLLLARIFITAYSGFFIGGAVLYRVRQHGVTGFRMILLGGAFVLAIRQSLFKVGWISAHFGQPFSRLAVIGCVTLFFAFLLMIALRRTGHFAALRLSFLGAITYPLYLIHETMGYILFNHLVGLADRAVIFWGVCALMIMIAALIHILVEKPFAPLMRSGLRALRDRTVLRASLTD